MPDSQEHVNPSSTTNTLKSSGARRILVTSALPYANNSLHIGHLVEYLQTDFWYRFQKMRGHEVYYICGDDTHGTPIMIEARRRGITPETLIAEQWKAHFKDFTDFQIEFSHYSSTNSEENRILCEEFYHAMVEKGHIRTKSIEQLYCLNDKMFLPDRFVKGTCPNCGSPDQYGDSCDKCGATYSPSELKNPYCALCGTAPILKGSEHVLFQLNHHKEFLREWLPGHLSKEMTNKMLEWFNEDLRDWDICRDDPYFGFKIPKRDRQYFYVWVDAPMGYVSASRQYFDAIGKPDLFQEFWGADSKAELYHIIGKDIVYFHTLFWPALLRTANYRLPTKVFVHGMLNINGEKMSKSKGAMISVRTYLNHLNPLGLRYYYASKMSGGVDDLNLNMEELVNRFNAEFVGKITNLASRGAQMLGKKMDGMISDMDEAGLELVRGAQASGEIIAQNFEDRDFNKGLTEIRRLADEANRYFDERAPWKTIEVDPVQTKRVLSATLNLFRIIAVYLKPIVPHYVAQVEQLFREGPYDWSSANKILKDHRIADYTHLAQRMEMAQVEAMLNENSQLEEQKKAKKLAEAPTPASKPGAAGDRNAPLVPKDGDGTIEIGDFDRVDLRVGKIISAEAIPEADKLLKLQVDLGPMGTRQIFAGIKAAYQPESLVGRLTVIVANLKPRKMKFGMSEGMVLAAGRGGSELFILSPDSGAQPGEKVK